MLPLAALFLFVAASASLLAANGDLPSPLLAHAFFAAAALPLMLGAILHFVPVLTRSAGPARAVAVLPWLAAFAGWVVTAVFAGVLPRLLLPLAALLAGAAALVIGGWIIGRRRRTLGAPHPGAAWYLAALGFLLLAMGAVFGIVFDTGHYPFWRKLHLHANLFGWIGLTALGTLPVLLPTALKKPEPGAAARLKRELPLAAAGVLVLALGAALASPIPAAGGALLLAVVPLRSLLAWRRSFGVRGLAQGVPAALAMATDFLAILLLVGIAHGFGLLPAERLVPAFVFGFLLPLVSGALAQLLPVWRFAGPETPAREAFRSGLARHSGQRGLLFGLAGFLQLGGVAWAALPAAAGVLAFLLALALNWRRRPVT